MSHSIEFLKKEYPSHFGGGGQKLWEKYSPFYLNLIQETFYFAHLTATYNLLEVLQTTEKEALRYTAVLVWPSNTAWHNRTQSLFVNYFSEHMLESGDDQIRVLCIQLLCDLFKVYSPHTRHSQRVTKKHAMPLPEQQDKMNNKDDICAGYVLQSLAEEWLKLMFKFI